MSAHSHLLCWCGKRLSTTKVHVRKSVAPWFCAEKLCGAPEPTEFGMNFVQRLCWVASSRLVQGDQLACNCDCLYKLINSCCAQKYKPFEVAQPGLLRCSFPRSHAVCVACWAFHSEITFLLHKPLIANQYSLVWLHQPRVVQQQRSNLQHCFKHCIIFVFRVLGSPATK